MSEEEEHQEIEYYGDEYIATAHADMPTWLRFSHIFWIFWGFFWFYLFWNGSYGWLDRGYWQQLQRAANTTFPTENLEDMTRQQIQKLQSEEKD